MSCEEVGAGRRDRGEAVALAVSRRLESPLVWRLLARAFGDTPSGPCEFGSPPRICSR